jgi:hypothetical protein
MVRTVALLAAAALGLSAGAVLAEGAVLVPYWRSLSPEAFLAWYRRNAGLLFRFFAPLELVAALLSILAAVVASRAASFAAPLLTASAVLALAVLAMFPLYFQRVNASFAAGTIAIERVAGELRRWSRWHWARVVVATLAFLVALLAAFDP